MNEIGYFSVEKPGRVQAVISQYLQNWPTRPIMEHRHQPDQDCSTSHSSVTTILKFLYSARSHPELLSLCFNHYSGIPCTYGNIAYIDINCKNNRQMPAAWKVWRIGVKISFVFALPAPSHRSAPTLFAFPVRNCRALRATEKLRSCSRGWAGLTVGQPFCFSN